MLPRRSKLSLLVSPCFLLAFSLCFLHSMYSKLGTPGFIAFHALCHDGYGNTSATCVFVYSTQTLRPTLVDSTVTILDNSIAHSTLQMFLNVGVGDHTHNLDLIRDLLQDSSDLLITCHESKFRIFETLLLRKLLNEHAGCS